MNLNEYLQKVSNVIDIYNQLKNQRNNLDGTKQLYYAINSLRIYSDNLSRQQAEEWIAVLNNGIIVEGKPVTDPAALAVQKTALAYLHYYTNCKLDYYMYGDRFGQEFLFNNIYNASEYPEYFCDETYDDEQQYYIKTLLLGWEAEMLKKRAMKLSGANRLVLYGFNEDVICEKLVTPKYAQIAICGPVTKVQNDSFCYYKYNLKTADGKTYGGKENPYDSFAYAQLADNCTAATNLYNYISANFKRIKSQDKFKGCFYTFSGDELKEFSDFVLARCKHNISDIDGCRYINGEQERGLKRFGE